MNAATHTNAGRSARGRGHAISVGCRASTRSMVTRVRYAVVIKEFRRVGAAHLMTLPIRETAIETVLEHLVSGPQRSEALHVREQVGGVHSLPAAQSRMGPWCVPWMTIRHCVPSPIAARCSHAVSNMDATRPVTPNALRDC